MYHPQKMLLVLAVVAASVALSGCFHHQKSYTAEALPPPVMHPPIK
jgi:outer membrane murein-binding lipoprotein Lpp